MAITVLKKVDSMYFRQDKTNSKTEIEALFAQASALFAGKRYYKAASVYVATVPLTRVKNDPVLTMESWLMSAYCQEIIGNSRWALAFARAALHHAERIPYAVRPVPTIANIGESIIRNIRTIKQTEPASKLPTEEEIDKRMVILLGNGWRDRGISLEQLLGADAMRFGYTPCPARGLPNSIAV